MDVTTYANATVLCRRLAGRLSDVVLEAVRVYYFVGEGDLADASLLVSLAMEDVQITPAERDLIRAVVADPNAAEFEDLRVVDEPVIPVHDFQPAGPPTAPDPARADDILAAEADRHRVHSLHRTWRSSTGDPGTGTWVYVAMVGDSADELGVHSALSSRLGVSLRVAWPIEAVAVSEPNSYQDRALAGAVQVS
ncbi:hypothetical protein [Jiangella muralis]|uniref:hypothetical protein n=1 Tax=Jiangella muralis TaxID=702383 RepID=UPI00069E9F4F|nr:hypothetical protein [Jiangella muralis]